MRNLVPLQLQLTLIELAAGSSLLPLVAFETLSGTTFVVSSDHVLFGVSPASNDIQVECDLKEQASPGSKVTGLEYIPDLESVCITSDAGDILVYNVPSRQLESVGEIDSGISCMGWSPDYEFVILITGNNSVIQMTNDWDVVTEVPLHSDCPEICGLNPSSVSWRADGKVFAVNCVHPETQKPILKIFDRSCSAESSSEPTPGLQNPLVSWRPSGEIIAAVQKQDKSTNIVFYERNGLRHYEFALLDNSRVLSLDWNSNSEVLAIVLALENNETAVQLWHRNNYHWYKKQDWRVGSSNKVEEGRRSEAIVAVRWDAEKPMELRVILDSGRIIKWTFCWDIDSSLSLSPLNPSLTAVIDGPRLLLTPFRHLSPPPPSSASVLDFGPLVSVNAVAFSRDSQVLVLLNDNSLAIHDQISEPTVAPRLKARLAIPHDQLDLSTCRQPIWIHSHFVMLIQTVLEAGSQDDRLVLIELDPSEGSLKGISLVSSLPQKPLRLYFNPDSFSILLESVTGEIFKVQPRDAKVLSTWRLVSHSKLPHPCHKIATTVFGPPDDQQETQKEEVIIALNDKSRLYINGLEASTECNSFAIHDQYILFTTNTHTLRFIDHSLPFKKELLDTTPAHAHDTCVREVERGSRLVSVVPFDSKVILQMPRGNLEIIYPRALQLAICRMLIDRKDYKNAFLEMRRHRFDLNFLYDYNPSQFLDHVDDFVRQLEKPSFLNLFISSLYDQDVTKSLFARREEKIQQSSLPQYLVDLQETANDAASGGKVTKICTKIRESLEASPLKDRYLISIISTYMCSKPPQLENALNLIKQLRQDELIPSIVDLDTISSSSSSSSSSSAAAAAAPVQKVSSDKAIEYAIFLADVEALYNVALGMYDFDLVVMVAQKSSKDPKEYIPFLTEIKKLQPEALQRHRIDCYLERWDRALDHLSQCGPEHFEDCLQLIKRRSIFLKGLDVFDFDPDAQPDLPDKDKELRQSQSNRVWGLYGQHLMENAQFEEAGRAFLRGNQLEDAMKAFRNTENWRKVMVIGKRLGKSPEEMKKLAVDLTASLINSARFVDAASVLLDYCDDPTRAVSALINACSWTEAIRISYKHDLDHLVSHSIRPAVLESFRQQSDLLEEKTALFIKYFERLQVVKTNNVLLPRLVHFQAETDVSGLFSDTSSMASSASGSYTMVSTVSAGGTRRRKKKRKKRVTGKEGSPYEEEFLVNALKDLVPSQSFQEEIKSLLVALVELGFRPKAIQLQHSFSEFLKVVHKANDIILAPIIGSGIDDDDEDATKEPPKPKLFVEIDWALNSLPRS